MHRTLLGMGGQMMQQMSGVNLITYVSLIPSYRKGASAHVLSV